MNDRERILHDLMDMELFSYLYTDEPATIHRFADRLTPFFEAALQALLQCEAEVVWWGANHDQQVPWPTFFRDEIVACDFATRAAKPCSRAASANQPREQGPRPMPTELDSRPR